MCGGLASEKFLVERVSTDVVSKVTAQLLMGLSKYNK